MNEVEELAELVPPLKYPRRDLGRIEKNEEDDPYNAFVRFCRVEGAETGPLVGRRVAVKDNLAIAGLPVSNASRTASYVPEVDAVVVERILDAGGTIVGKLNLDDSSAGAFGESSVFGPPRNPRKPTHSAGGSSGGAGAAVVSGAVDMALGVDEGGSARVPAAFCGCVAIKATHGLVPSFGLTYFDHTLDYVCPLARTVEETAVLLEVIAGDDWRDPQWVRGPIEVQRYSEAASGGVEGMRVGAVDETLNPEFCEPAVLQGLSRVCDILEGAGATVENVSIPILAHTSAIWMGVFLGSSPAMMRTDGLGYNHLGYVEVERVHAARITRRQEASDFSTFIKLLLIANSYLQENYGHVIFAKAHNQRLVLRNAVDTKLQAYDLLLTPTTPTTAPPLAVDRLDLTAQVERLPKAGVFFPFTQAFNLSGHPALVFPSGLDEEGLPTSVQVISRQFAEYDAFRAAFVIEEGLAASGHRVPPLLVQDEV